MQRASSTSRSRRFLRVLAVVASAITRTQTSLSDYSNVKDLRSGWTMLIWRMCGECLFKFNQKTFKNKPSKQRHLINRQFANRRASIERESGRESGREPERQTERGCHVVRCKERSISLSSRRSYGTTDWRSVIIRQLRGDRREILDAHSNFNTWAARSNPAARLVN